MFNKKGKKMAHQRLLQDESGQGMTEYIIIVALIAVAAIVTVGFFGDSIKARFAQVTAYVSGQPATDAEEAMGTASENATGTLSTTAAEDVNFDPGD